MRSVRVSKMPVRPVVAFRINNLQPTSPISPEPRCWNKLWRLLCLIDEMYDSQGLGLEIGR
jgi:hypothetical protein